MNRPFNGVIKSRGSKKPKGYGSRAARQAFKDILEDPDMRVKCDSGISIHIILDESILNYEAF